MSRLGLSASQVLSRCGNCLIKTAQPGTPTSMGFMVTVPLSHNVRRVSTTRSKKAQAMKDTAKETVTAPPKETVAKAAAGATKPKKAATKTKKPAKEGQADAKATPAKSGATKPKAAASAAAGKKTKTKPVVTPQETKAAADPETKAAAAPAAPASVTKATEFVASKAAAPSSAATPKRVTASQKQPAPSAPKPAASVSTPKPTPSATPSNLGPKVDTSSPKYKAAARKWTSTMIALPILIVTSYFLFDRLALGNQPISALEKARAQISGVSADGSVKPGDAE